MNSMRRLASVAAFALFLAVPVWAQHGGGGHGGGGGHAGSSGGGHSFGGGGFSGGHASSSFGAHSFSGSHSYSGLRSGSGSSRSFNRGFSRPGYSQPYLHNETGLNNQMRANGLRANNRIGFHGNGVGVRINTWGFNNFGFGNRWFHNNCLAWRCGGWGYPWWGWGYYDPWFWNWGNDGYYDDGYYQNLSIAQQMNELSLEEQRLRQQQAYDEQQYENDGPGDQRAYNGPYSRPDYAPRTSAGEQAEEAVATTILVFRDQHKEEVHNYAIVGQTLWNFSPQRTQKIPLNDLDLASTTKVNQDRGVTFRVPVAEHTPAVPPASLQEAPPANHSSSSV